MVKNMHRSEEDGEVMGAGVDLVLSLFGVMACVFAAVAGSNLELKATAAQRSNELDQMRTESAGLQVQAQKSMELEAERKALGDTLERVRSELELNRSDLDSERRKRTRLNASFQTLRQDASEKDRFIGALKTNLREALDRAYGYQGWTPSSCLRMVNPIRRIRRLVSTYRLRRLERLSSIW